MTTEAEVATRLAHQDRIAAVLSRTGGEIMHPDHYDLREALRLAVLHAIDETTQERCVPKMSDGELPNLFDAVDAIAERIFLKSVEL